MAGGFWRERKCGTVLAGKKGGAVLAGKKRQDVFGANEYAGRLRRKYVAGRHSDCVQNIGVGAGKGGHAKLLSERTYLLSLGRNVLICLA